MSEGNNNNVQLEFVRSRRLEKMATAEKIRMILDSVKEEKIVILEDRMEPDEESKLIEATMKEINPDNFSGIEIESYKDKEKSSGIFDRFMPNDDPQMTIIGPSNQLSEVNQDEDIMTAMISNEEEQG